MTDELKNIIAKNSIFKISQDENILSAIYNFINNSIGDADLISSKMIEIQTYLNNLATTKYYNLDYNLFYNNAVELINAKYAKLLMSLKSLASTTTSLEYRTQLQAKIDAITKNLNNEISNIASAEKFFTNYKEEYQAYSSLLDEYKLNMRIYYSNIIAKDKSDNLLKILQ